MAGLSPGHPDRPDRPDHPGDPAELGAILSGPVLEVAPRLLGSLLTHAGVTVRLTEVEAYAGHLDPASHAYRGPTARTEVMFGPAGRLYVYRSYGLHWCANVVTGQDGSASAVLVRAGEVVDGVERARERRGPRVGDQSLARGPGCVAQALGLSGEHGGADLVHGVEVHLRLGDPVPPDRVRRGPRVGVRLAHEEPWRFWIEGDPTVSAYKRSPRAVPGGTEA
ncbi:MAG: 3-methyladenine glycosylase [Marmoricola sp.]|nr:3-methyladenine glycosylase [Marmoricola sp.]